jgi:hypothetical protein
VIQSRMTSTAVPALSGSARDALYDRRLRPFQTNEGFAVPARSLAHRPRARERLRGCAGGLDSLTKAWLVVFKLNGQMSGGFESLLDFAGRAPPSSNAISASNASK